MSFIVHPVTLEGTRVKLIPMVNDHFEALWQVAQDKRVWELMSVKLWEKEKLLTHLKTELLKRATGEHYPFTVIDKVTGRIFGHTMFHNIYPENYKLEIGWTWYDPSYWRTGYNRECKLLLLTYCFEQLKTKRVQFQCDEVNTRSWDAILGIGAKLEGILRNERMRPDGTCRNTPIFSIIDSEWGDVKEQLKGKILP